MTKAQLDALAILAIAPSALAAQLRQAGVPVSTAEALDLARALAHVDATNRAQVRAAVRTTVIKDPVHLDKADVILDRTLMLASRSRTDSPHDQGTPTVAGPSPEGTDAESLRNQIIDAILDDDRATEHALAHEAVNQFAGLDGETRGDRHHVSRLLRGLGLNALLQALLASAPATSGVDRALGIAESNRRVAEFVALLEALVAQRLDPSRPAIVAESQLGDVPILDADANQLALMRQTLRPMARTWATRLGRRRRRGRGSVDVRRTIRANLGSGGVLMQLTLRKRRPSRPELVVLCDISGSVAEFSSFTLGLTHALQDEFTAVRSWVFIDGIVEVTQLVRESGGQFDPRTLLAQRGLITGDGRSDYASALSVFLTVWRSTVHAGTTVLIIGDARMHERRAPIPELNELRHLSRRLYWLNPESTSDWDTKDSVAGRLAAHVDDMLEVSTLRMLGDAVSSLS